MHFRGCYMDEQVAAESAVVSTIPNTVRIRRALENAIVDGRYPPGSRLDPESLAREFDCSRTPIREALQQLEASGLVQVLPKRGTYVSEWSAGELAERFEVMAEVEAMCARLAARRITDAELAAFEAVHAACRELAEAGEVEAYYVRNSDFHHCIYMRRTTPSSPKRLPVCTRCCSPIAECSCRFAIAWPARSRSTTPSSPQSEPATRTRPPRRCATMW